MRKERLHKRIMANHETTTKKCIVKSASAVNCIEKMNADLELIRAVPNEYNTLKKSLDKTCKARCTRLIIRKANYFKN